MLVAVGTLALGGLLILALGNPPVASAQAPTPAQDDEIVRLIFEVFKDPPLSDAQRAAVEKFAHDADPEGKHLLPDFLAQHRDPEAKRRFRAAAPEGSRAYAAFYERTVAGLNAALGDRGYAMPLHPLLQRAHLPPELDTPHIRLMVQARRTEDPRERIRLYTEALASVGGLDLRLSSPLARYERAMTYFELHDVRSAFDDLTADLSLYPGHPEGLYHRALAASMLERWNVAIRDSTELLKLAPDFPLAYVARGQAWAELGDYAAALKDLDRAVAADPQNLWARLSRGGEHWLRGRAEEAVADYAVAVGLSTGSALGYGGLGFAYLDSGRFAEAGGAFEAALRLDAEDAGSHAGLAISRLRSGDVPGAESGYARAVALEPLFGVSAASVAARGSRWVKAPEGGESLEVYRFSRRAAAAIDELIGLRGGRLGGAPPGSAPLASAPSAWAEPPLKARLGVDSPGERLKAMDGRLIPSQADLVLESKVYVEAWELRRRSAYRRLPPEVLKGLEGRWKEIEAEKARLIAQARTLDREGRKLYRRGVKLEKAAVRLTRKRDSVDRSIDGWSRDCANSSARCFRRKASLEKKARRLDRALVGHNARVEGWRSEVAALDRRVGDRSPP